MQQAIDYLKRLRELSRREAEGYDADFPERKKFYSSVYWSDYYAFSKVIEVLEAAPQEPEASRINFERFRAALEKEGFSQEETMRINGALVGAMLGRKIDADTSESVQRDRGT